MDQRAARPDAFGNIRRDFLDLDDIDRKGRSIQRDAENLEELARPVQPFDRNVQIRDLAETLTVEERPPLVDAVRIHPRRDLRNDRSRVSGSSREALVNSRTPAFRSFREKRARLVEIDSEFLSHGARL